MVFQRMVSRKSAGSSSDFMQIAPPMTSLWPPMNLLALSTTRSTPHSRGRSTQGLAKVLSQMTTMPRAWASVTSGSIAAVFMVGLAMASK